MERTIPEISSIEDSKNLLSQFESVDETHRDRYAPSLYLQMWKVALSAGKLSLANSYAKKSLGYLIDLKRIPQLRNFIKTLNDSGLFRNKAEDYLIAEEILVGKRNQISLKDLEYIELFCTHPHHWKHSAVFLKQYLLLEEDWGVEMWKLCYEYILLHHFDKEIFELLLDKARESKNKDYEKKLMALFASKKIKLSAAKNEIAKLTAPVEEKLNLDYDQIAMDLLSGVKEPSSEEQRRVINSLKFISPEELLTKGQEMIVAFELLGMEKVVLVLCESLIQVLSDVKQRASTFYVWVQALFNSGEFYKAIDLVDEVLQTEPLYGEERIAFLYIKAEACLKLDKKKLAKEIYMAIKKQSPQYRLVGERLKLLETLK